MIKFIKEEFDKVKQKIKAFFHYFQMNIRDIKLEVQKYGCHNKGVQCSYKYSYDDWHCDGCKHKDIEFKGYSLKERIAEIDKKSNDGKY